MTLTFTVLEKPDVNILADILEIEREAFGDGALNEYVVVPLMRYGKIYAAVDEEGTAVACAYFMADINNPDNAYLMSVAVLPDFRGQNVGTALLEYALDGLKEYGISKVTLTVDPSNFTALSVYREKLGFTVIDSVRDEYGEGEDRLVMAKEI